MFLEAPFDIIGGVGVVIQNRTVVGAISGQTRCVEEGAKTGKTTWLFPFKERPSALFYDFWGNKNVILTNLLLIVTLEEGKDTDCCNVVVAAIWSCIVQP